MIVKCDRCGSEFKKKPSDVKPKNYCSRACVRNRIVKPCGTCGKDVVRTPATSYDTVFCSKKCFRVWASKRFTESNPDWNQTKMTLEVRTKLRESRLGKGEGKTYTKTFSRHTHRIVAETKLGRTLLPGEVVHHIDEDKRNNDPSNLHVYANVAEHSRHHMLKRLKEKKNAK